MSKKENIKAFIGDCGYQCSKCGGIIIGTKNKETICQDCQIAELKQQLAKRDKEIERLKMAFKDMRCLKNRAIKSLKDTVNELREGLADQRHQICEKIREWYREQELIMEEWLIDCLDQIEKEKKNENFEEK